MSEFITVQVDVDDVTVGKTFEGFPVFKQVHPERKERIGKVIKAVVRDDHVHVIIKLNKKGRKFWYGE